MGRCVLIKLALSGSYLGWGTITVAGDEPGFVVVPGELDERGSQLFDGIEVRAHNRFSFKVRMKRSATPLPWGASGTSERH